MAENEKMNESGVFSGIGTRCVEGVSGGMFGLLNKLNASYDVSVSGQFFKILKLYLLTDF